MSLPDNPPIVFMDTETTSLRPDRRFWDIGAIKRMPDGAEEEFQFFVHVDELDLGNADAESLRIGRFYQRHPQMNPDLRLTIRASAARFDDVAYEKAILEAFEQLTRGAIIVGAVPNFDTEVIAARMRAHNLCPSWHYHLTDVETLAAGRLGIKPPYSFDQILAMYGITVDEEKRHTALGDAYLNLYLYDAVYDRSALGYVEQQIRAIMRNMAEAVQPMFDPADPLQTEAARRLNFAKRAETGFIARGGITFPLEPGLDEVFENTKQAETGETR